MQHGTYHIDKYDKLIKNLSNARMSKYIDASYCDIKGGILIYFWNMKLSQALQPLLGLYEVILRNSINSFFIWKYGRNWILDNSPIHRDIKRNLSYKIKDKIDELKISKSNPNLDIFISNMSLGFWSAIIQYNSMTSLRLDSINGNINKVFPYGSFAEKIECKKYSLDILNLRNRIAHQERIFDLELDKLHEIILLTIKCISPDALKFVENSSYFKDVWDRKPPCLKR